MNIQNKHHHNDLFLLGAVQIFRKANTIMTMIFVCISSTYPFEYDPIGSSTQEAYYYLILTYYETGV